MLYYDFGTFLEDFFVPLYEYLCGKCGHRCEKIERHSAAMTKKCPKCGGKAERMTSRTSMQFKGSGWYVTDYGGRPSSAEEKKGDSAAAGAEAKKSDSSETGAKAKKSDSTDAGVKAEPAKTESAPKKKKE
jgi:putative FmdB family regulatory protein